jgi:2-oxoisovalerate dehydrogenase E2 component (dihydrolipoyl transacylase)
MEVKLHDIGEGMTEAHVSHYFVKKGDEVKADEPLVEVQTDKMTAEIPAPSSGVIKEIIVREGETIPVGTTVLIIEPIGSMPAKSRKSIVVHSQRVLASPYTRKIARDNGIAIDEVKGTGPSGRIMDHDVYEFMSQQNTKEKAPQFIQETTPQISNKKIHQEAVPFRGRRKQIAHKMSQSLKTIPHCTHFEEIDMTELLQLKNTIKERNLSISISAFLVKALSLALKEYPIFNARLDENKEQILLEKEHHIGLATDTEEGLIVPIIRHVEMKNVKEIAGEMKILSKKAINNELTVKDVSGGTFTVSNVGPLHGSIGATPIINHPEVALVSFHKTKKRPVVNDQDEIVVRSIMNISMSFDHRIADGATAVAFTNRFAQLIENPSLMIVELI